MSPRRTWHSATSLPQAIGLLLGLWNAEGDLGILGDSMATWENISPELILVIFLPALIFGSALSVDYHVFAKEIGQMLLLAVPGVIISAVLTSLFAVYALPYDWGWNEGLAFGAMMSATDPVAVVSSLSTSAPAWALTRPPGGGSRGSATLGGAHCATLTARCPLCHRLLC